MIIAVTERSTFLRCRRLWSYTSANMESLGTIIPRTNLSLGKVMHEALAHWLEQPEQLLADLFVQAVHKDLETTKKAYRSKVGCDPSDDELGNYYADMQLGVAMATNYQKKWGTPLFTNFSLVQAEVELQVPIPNTEHFLTARLDAIICDNNTQDLYILEHKTYKSRPRQDILQQNDQFLAYIWAAQKALNSHRIVGIAYDGMWKREKPPRGSEFDDLFTRLLITRPEYEVDDYGTYLIETVRDMDVAKARADNDNAYSLYPNRVWQGCYECPMEKLCAMQSRGEDYQHYKNTNYTKVNRDKEILDGE